MVNLSADSYNPHSTMHIVTFDENDNLINSYVVDYERKKTIDLPANAKTLKVSYRYKFYDGNYFLDQIFHSPFHVFEINYDDTDGDGFDDLVDCDPLDSTKYYLWTNIVKDHDGDGYYPAPEENLCAGFDYPEGYVLVQDGFKLDCDDTDPQKYRLVTVKNNSDNQESLHCWNEVDPIDLTDYSLVSPYGVTGGSLGFVTDPDQPDIYYFSAYEFGGPLNIFLEALTKDTYIYIGSYHTADVIINTSGGESFLKGVYRVGYDPQKSLTVTDGTTTFPNSNFDTYSSDKGDFSNADIRFDTWYNEGETYYDQNAARSGLLGLP